jgi:hypothetical protein
VIDVQATTADAPGFLEHVRRAGDGVCNLLAPPDLYLIHVANWFDAKWLRFSGKALGALSFWKYELTVPPFHPHRVRSETLLRKADNAYRVVPIPNRPVHVYQESSRNLQRFMHRALPNTACLWYSSDSAAIGRGSLMVYAPRVDDYWAWYADCHLRNGAWDLRYAHGISRQEFQQLGVRA